MASMISLLSSLLSRIINYSLASDANHYYIIQRIGDQLLRQGEYEKCYRLFAGLQRRVIDLGQDDHYRWNTQLYIQYQVECLLQLGKRRHALDVCMAATRQSPSAMWFLWAADMYTDKHQLQLALMMVRRSYSCLSQANPIWNQVCFKERILHDGILQQRGRKLLVGNEGPEAMDMALLLPFDVVCSILKLLPFDNLVCCARVNRKWNYLVNSTPLLWQRLHFYRNTRPLPTATLALYLSRLNTAPLQSLRIPNVQDPEGLFTTLCQSNCSQLYELELAYMQYTSQQSWNLFCQLMRSAGKALRVLRLGCGGFRLTSIIDLVATACPGLEIMDLRSSLPLKDDPLYYDATSLEQLERYGGDLPSILLDYAAGLPTLPMRRLVLSDHHGLTPLHLAMILIRSPRLSDLALLNCSVKITPVINLLPYIRLQRLHYYDSHPTMTADLPSSPEVIPTSVTTTPRITVDTMSATYRQSGIRNSARDDGDSTMAHCSWKTIVLKQTRILTDDLLHSLLATSSHAIEKLDLEGNPQLTDISLTTIIQHRRHHKVSLRHLDNNNDTTLGLIHLGELGLADCTGMTELGLCTFFRFTPHLRQLNLSGLSSVTDKVLMTIALHCPRLLKLNLSRCGTITDSGVCGFIDTFRDKNMALHYLGLAATTLSIDTLAYALCHVQQDGI